jgi:hypothetical protein
MRRGLVPILVFAVAFALFVAGCGGSSDDVKAGAPLTTTTSPVVSSPPLPPGPQPSAPGRGVQRVEPTNDAVDVQPLTFDVHDVDATSGGVLVRFWGGVAPCFVLDHYAVTQTGLRVTIGLFAGHAPRNDKVACIELALRYEVKVPLDAPLGTRTVVDANA